MKHFFLPGVVLCLLVVIAAPAFPQATSRVTGTVSDPSGAVIQGASVSLMNEATNVIVSTVTTSTGTYVFDGIIPGTYSLTITASGFATYTSSGNVAF